MPTSERVEEGFLKDVGRGILRCLSKSLRSARLFGINNPMKVSPDIVVSLTESLDCN